VESRRLRFAAFEIIVTHPNHHRSERKIVDIPVKVGASHGDSKKGWQAGGDGFEDSSARRGCQEQRRAIEVLSELGFGSGVADHSAFAINLEEAVAAGKSLLAKRTELPFETDGCVLKVNSIAVC
jgi:hypothetical protein